MQNLVYSINTINNAILLKKYKIVLTRFNYLTLNILRTLQKINAINSFKVNNQSTLCTVYLSTEIAYNVFQKIICVSKPNKYIYCKLTDLMKLRAYDLYSDYILSINHFDENSEIVSIDEAIRLRKGGLLLIKVLRT